jgi:tRNA(Leu) C34 or U34 (ribose-2'-O)-methylase TrmL
MAAHLGIGARAALHVVLCHPGIPGNTGAVARSALAFGAALHVVAPCFDVASPPVLRAAVGYARRPAAGAEAAVAAAAAAAATTGDDGRDALHAARMTLYSTPADFAARALPWMQLVYPLSKAGRHGERCMHEWGLARDVADVARASGAPTVNVALVLGNETFGLDRAWPWLEARVTRGPGGHTGDDDGDDDARRRAAGGAPGAGGGACVYIPMAPGVRSLNLAVAASVGLYEACRALHAAGIACA